MVNDGASTIPLVAGAGAGAMVGDVCRCRCCCRCIIGGGGSHVALCDSMRFIHYGRYRHHVLVLFTRWNNRHDGLPQRNGQSTLIKADGKQGKYEIGPWYCSCRIQQVAAIDVIRR